MSSRPAGERIRVLEPGAAPPRRRRRSTLEYRLVVALAFVFAAIGLLAVLAGVLLLVVIVLLLAA